MHTSKTEQAFQKTIDYLYKIDGDITQEQYQAISTLRQLINEEFKPKIQVSNQFIYNILKDIL